MNQKDTYIEYEPELDLKDFLFHILYRWRSILLAAILFCTLLSGFGVIRRESVDALKEQKKNREYELELAEYKLKLTAYEQDIADYQVKLEQQKTYMEKSVLMNTDPYTKPRAYADFLVKLNDTEWQALPDNVNIDPTDSLVRMYTFNFSANLDWEPIEELTGNEKLYLEEMLEVSSDYSSNSFSVSVVYPNGEIAQQILDIVVEQIMEKYQLLRTNISQHTLSIINQSLTYSIDTDLADSQKNGADAIVEYEQNILDCRNKLEDLADQEPTKPIGNEFLKYPIIGLAAGIFLMVAFYAASYLLGGRLHGEGELKNRYGYSLLGVFPLPERSGFLHGIDKFLDRLAKTSENTDKTGINQRIAVNITNLADRKKKILMTGTVNLEKLQGITNEIAPLLNDISLVAATNMNRETNTLKLLADCDGVILVEEQDKSLISEIQKEQESIRSLGKPVIGYVLL